MENLVVSHCQGPLYCFIDSILSALSDLYSKGSIALSFLLFQASQWRCLDEEKVYLTFGCHPKFAHRFDQVGILDGQGTLTERRRHCTSDLLIKLAYVFEK